MTDIGPAARNLGEVARAFEREWDRVSGVWVDVRQQEFERTVVVTLVRSTSTMVREMEAASEVVRAALRTL